MAVTLRGGRSALMLCVLPLPPPLLLPLMLLVLVGEVVLVFGVLLDPLLLAVAVAVALEPALPPLGLFG